MIGTTAAIIGSAVVGGVATSMAASKAAKATKQAAAQNAQTISDTQAKNDALMAPFIQSGTKATNAIEDFLGLGGTGAQDQAFQNWRNSTGYQFNLNQGLDALNSNLALKGQLKSGTAMKSAQQYGTNLANQFGQQYLGNLQQQQGVGLSAAGQNAASNSSAASGQVANNQWLAGAKADAAMTGANAFNNILSNATSAYGMYQGQKMDSSYTPQTGPGSGAGVGTNVFGRTPTFIPQRAYGW